MSDIQCRVLNNEYSIFYISNCCLTSMIKLTLHMLFIKLMKLYFPIQYPTVSRYPSVRYCILWYPTASEGSLVSSPVLSVSGICANCGEKLRAASMGSDDEDAVVPESFSSNQSVVFLTCNHRLLVRSYREVNSSRPFG